MPDTPTNHVILKIVPSRRGADVMAVRVGPATSGTARTPSRLVAAISPRGVDSLSLRVGMPWTQELEQAVARRVVYEHARRSATRWLTRQPMTRAAVALRLKRYTLAPADHAALLEELETLGLINDADYAARMADLRVQREPIAAEALAESIERRGVPRADAEAAAREALREHEPAQDARQVATKRARTMPHGTSEVTVRRRLYEYLARRGFDEETATQAVEHVVRERGRSA